MTARGIGGRFTANENEAAEVEAWARNECDGDDCKRRDCELHYMNAPLRLAGDTGGSIPEQYTEDEFAVLCDAMDEAASQLGQAIDAARMVGEDDDLTQDLFKLLMRLNEVSKIRLGGYRPSVEG